MDGPVLVDLSRLSRLVIVPVGGISRRLANVANSLSNQELVEYLSAGGKQTPEQSMFKLLDHHTLPNGLLNQGREHRGHFHKHI